jgi:hypothetical protein
MNFAFDRFLSLVMWDVGIWDVGRRHGCQLQECEGLLTFTVISTRYQHREFARSQLVGVEE